MCRTKLISNKDCANLHVLFTITRYWPIIGGAELHTHELIQRLVNRHQVTVITQMEGAYHQWVRRTTILAPGREMVYQDGSARVIRLGLSPIDKFFLLPFVLYYSVTGQLNHWALTRVIGRKMAQRAQGVDLIHAIHTGAYYLDGLAYDLAQKKKVPLVVTLYTHPAERSLASLRKLHQIADALIAMTESERTWLISQGVDAEKIFVTGGGPVLTSPPRVNSFKERHDFAHRYLVLFLGQKLPYKGYRQLLAAAPQVWQVLPDVGFAFIGPRYPESQVDFEQVADPRILELDRVSDSEKMEALQACNVLCVPSTEESLGMVFLEAWSFGKPVVGVDIPAIRELIEDGWDGFLVASEPTQIARRLIDLLSNEVLRQTMGQRGQQKVIKKYNWDISAAKTEEVYLYALNKSAQ